MDKATQIGKILAYCAEHGSITVRDAFVELNINSPTKRISEMRKSGKYKVDSIEESRTNQGGETKRGNGISLRLWRVMVLEQIQEPESNHIR